MPRPKRLLTPCQWQVLGYIAVECAQQGACLSTKRHIAEVLGCNPVTVDRAVRELRDRGFIEVEERHGTDGAQVGNAYRIVSSAPSGSEAAFAERPRSFKQNI